MRSEAGHDFDVVVVGAGNAGLCAALAARERGARVLVLEKAPLGERGGDTAFTGALYRFPFDDPASVGALLPVIDADLIAYQKPLYQVLDLAEKSVAPSQPSTEGPARSVADILRQALGGAA